MEMELLNLTTDTIADIRYTTENSTSVCSWNSSTSVLNQNNVGFVVNSKLLCFSGVILVGLVGSCGKRGRSGCVLVEKTGIENNQQTDREPDCARFVRQRFSGSFLFYEIIRKLLCLPG